MTRNGGGWFAIIAVVMMLGATGCKSPVDVQRLEVYLRSDLSAEERSDLLVEVTVESLDEVDLARIEVEAVFLDGEALASDPGVFLFAFDDLPAGLVRVRVALSGEDIETRQTSTIVATGDGLSQARVVLTREPTRTCIQAADCDPDEPCVERVLCDPDERQCLRFRALDWFEECACEAAGDCLPPACETIPPVPGIPEGCEPLHPPPRRPRCSTDGARPPLEVGFALPVFSSLDGYDLDGHCTDSVGNFASCTNASAFVPAVDAGDRGVDNSFGRTILNLFASVDETLLAQFEATVRERGVSAPMLRIENWNGAPDDAAVTVTIAASVGAATTPVDWTSGTAELLPSESFFGSDGEPLTRTNDAYVTEGKLVATLTENLPFELTANGRRVRIGLKDARIVANMAPEEGPTDLLVVGRWEVEAAVIAMDDFLPCPEDALYRMMAGSLIRSAADIRSDATTDGLGAECNAISVALRFTNPHPIVWGPPSPLTVGPMCAGP